MGKQRVSSSTARGRPEASRRRAHPRLPRDRAAAAAGATPAPGRPLHGLRRSVLPRVRLPAAQPHPRVQRHGLPRPVARARSSCCTRRTTFPRSPAGSAPPRARPPARSASTRRPVSIRQIELQIVERGWREGWIVPQPAPRRTGKRVVVVGSGPAGPRRRAAAGARRPRRSSSSRRTTGSAASCATASPTSSSRSASSTGASSRCRPRASSSRPASTSDATCR